LDKLKKEVDALESIAPKAGTLPVKKARVTRNTPITCCRTYGPDRELLWSRYGFLICNHCRDLDSQRLEYKTQLLKMDTLLQCYQCTAGHISRAFPTALAPVKYVIKPKERKKREQPPDEGYEMSSMVDVKQDHVDEVLDADLDVKEQQQQQQKDEEMVEKFIEQVTRQREEIDAIAQNVSDIDGLMETLESDNAHKAIEIEALRSIIVELRDQNKNLEEDLSSMDEEVAKLKAQVKKNYRVKKNSKKASEAAMAAVDAVMTWRDWMKQANK
jgi:DNA repair exonuclease SbcCD ATPase subunit